MYTKIFFQLSPSMLPSVCLLILLRVHHFSVCLFISSYDICLCVCCLYANNPKFLCFGRSPLESTSTLWDQSNPPAYYWWWRVGLGALKQAPVPRVMPPLRPRPSSGARCYSSQRGSHSHSTPNRIPACWPSELYVYSKTCPSFSFTHFIS